MSTPKYTAKDRARFWSKVDKSGGKDACWEWRGGKDAFGYGRLNINRIIKSAHRISYELAYGAIGKSMSVCHTCDNPACVNPNHLWLGTIADNNRDRNDKGRTVYTTGELVGSCKLTDEQIDEILSRFHAGETNRRQLAREYGVSHQQIRIIVNGEGRTLGTTKMHYKTPAEGEY